MLSLIGSSSCSPLDMQPVLLKAPPKPLATLHGDQLADLMIVAGGMHRALARAVPEGNTSPRRKWAVPESTLRDKPLQRRKLAIYTRLKAGADFFTSCTQEAAWQMSDFPSGSLLCASQKGTRVVVKYYSNLLLAQRPNRS